MLYGRHDKSPYLCMHCGQGLSVHTTDGHKYINRVKFYFPVDVYAYRRRESLVRADDDMSEYLLCPKCFIRLKRAFPEGVNGDMNHVVNIGARDFFNLPTYMAFQILYNANYQYITTSAFDLILPSVDLDDYKNQLRMVMTEDWAMTSIGRTHFSFLEVDWTELCQVLFRMQGKPFYQDLHTIYYSLYKYKGGYGGDALIIDISTDPQDIILAADRYLSELGKERYSLEEKGSFKCSTTDITEMQRNILKMWKAYRGWWEGVILDEIVELHVRLGAKTFHSDDIQFFYQNETPY